jgi:hypothetical protein
VGLYELSSGGPGLLVAYGSALSNQKANKAMLAGAQQKPTYAEFANSPLQAKVSFLTKPGIVADGAKLRRKQVRNVTAVLHDALVALGFDQEAERGRIEGSLARPAFFDVRKKKTGKRSRIRTPSRSTPGSRTPRKTGSTPGTP